MGQQPGARPAPLDRQVRHGGLGDRLAAPAGELRAQVADHMEAARPILQDLGHVLAQPAQVAAARRTAAGRRVHHLLARSEEHTSELQSLMRSSYAVFCLKKKKLTLQL